MAKRITLRDLEARDTQQDTSIVREIEMMVDGICADAQIPTYPIQFWRDVNLYGLREAYIYLYNHIGNGHNVLHNLKGLSALNKRISEITG